MPITFRVLSVSSSELSTAAALRLIRSAGHSVDAATELALADLPLVLQRYREAAGVTVVCGDNDAVELARRQLDFERTGVGERYRQQLSVTLGVSAALAELACGSCGAGVLLAVAGGPEHLRVALDSLLLPLLGELMPRTRATSPTPIEPQAARGPSIDAAQFSPEGSAPTPSPNADEPADELADEPADGPAGSSGSGWEAGLLALGATLDRGRFPALPDTFDRLAPARNVLESAGERGLVTLADGRSLAAFGFPDLLRSGSKVLLVSATWPMPQIIALHRFPRRVGTTVSADDTAPADYLPDTDSDPSRVAVDRTGTPCPSPGSGVLFAVDGSTIYTLRDRHIWSWDGRRERDEGVSSQAIASLVLHWSQR